MFIFYTPIEGWRFLKKDGSTVSDGTTLFKHKGHDGHKGKPLRSGPFPSFVYFVSLVFTILSR